MTTVQKVREQFSREFRQLRIDQDVSNTNIFYSLSRNQISPKSSYAKQRTAPTKKNLPTKLLAVGHSIHSKLSAGHNLFEVDAFLTRPRDGAQIKILDSTESIPSRAHHPLQFNFSEDRTI